RNIRSISPEPEQGKIARMCAVTTAAMLITLAFAARPAAGAETAPDCADAMAFQPTALDYRTATVPEKNGGESYHFPQNAELLQSGTSGNLGADISFTLRAFPNHPRALTAMIRLGQRDHTTQPRGSTYTVDCWVERAVAFRPDDLVVRQIRGSYSAMERRF